MKIKIKKPIPPSDEVVKEPQDPRELLESFHMGTPLTPWSERLKNTVSAWKYLGNSWMTAMDCNMALSSKNVRFSTEIDVNDLRVLEHLGHMKATQLGFQDFWCRKYKLTDKGLGLLSKGVQQPKEETKPIKIKLLSRQERITKSEEDHKIIARVAKKAGEDSLNELQQLSTTKECKVCKGSGWDDRKDEECKTCDGTGELIVSSPEKTVSSKRTVKTVKRK